MQSTHSVSPPPKDLLKEHEDEPNEQSRQNYFITAAERLNFISPEISLQESAFGNKSLQKSLIGSTTKSKLLLVASTRASEAIHSESLHNPHIEIPNPVVLDYPLSNDSLKLVQTSGLPATPELYQRDVQYPHSSTTIQHALFRDNSLNKVQGDGGAESRLLPALKGAEVHFPMRVEKSSFSGIISKKKRRYSCPSLLSQLAIGSALLFSIASLIVSYVSWDRELHWEVSHSLLGDSLLFSSYNDTSQIPGGKLMYSLAKDTVSTDSIRDLAITNQKLSANSIDSRAILDASIAEDDLKGGCITAEKLAENSVLSRHLGLSIISSENMQESSVQGEHLAPDIISNAHIQDAAVTSLKISSNAIQSSHVASLAITTSHLMDRSITAQKVADNSISSSKIMVSAISNGNLGDNSVDSRAIQDRAVLGSDIALNTITDEHIAPSSLTGRVLSSISIGSNHLIDFSVGTSKIADHSVTSQKLAPLSVTTSLLKVFIFSVLLSEKKLLMLKLTLVKDDAVVGSKIAADSIGNEHIQAGAITADRLSFHVSVFASNGNSLATDIVDSRTILNHSIQWEDIANHAIDAFHLKVC
jgi:hypothetical protein